MPRHRHGPHRFAMVATGWLLAAWLPVPGGLAQEPTFLRGDANGDGAVTLADGFFIRNFVHPQIFPGAPAPACEKAADADDDGDIDAEDQMHVIEHWLRLRNPPCPPYPAPGTDPTADGLTCARAGGGAPVEDPEAVLEIVPSGAVDASGRTRLTVFISSSRPITGFIASLRVELDIFANGVRPGRNHLIEGVTQFAFPPVRGEALVFGAAYSLFEDNPLPPGQRVPVLEILPCLNPETTDGRYELDLEQAELVDHATGRSIHPRRIAEPMLLEGVDLGAVGGGCLDEPDPMPPEACVDEPPPGPQGVDFVRGDANIDGLLSAADAYAIARDLASAFPLSPCRDAADANDDAVVDISDALSTLDAFLRGGELPAPFPAAGPDPTLAGDPLGCDFYLPGEPVEGPGLTLELLDGVAPGGADGRALILMRVPAPPPSLAGLSGRLLLGAPIVEEAARRGRSIAPADEEVVVSAHGENDDVRFAFLTSLERNRFLSAGDGAVVLELELCLKVGTPAGEYALLLESGELVEHGTALSIHPTLVSGRLTVLADVGAGALSACSEAPPQDPDVRFELGSAQGRPGGDAVLPFWIEANAPIQGYSFSVGFDEEVLEGSSIEPFWKLPDGSVDYAFHVVRYDNANRESGGDGGVDEGFVAGTVVFSYLEPVVLPAGARNEVLRFHLTVKPGAGPGVTELPFLDGGRIGGQPVLNRVTAYGRGYSPLNARSFAFVAGSVEVLGDFTDFSRGDANGDGAFDLSDAQATLGYLFLGARSPHCYDAADANDDGRLDISDALYSLAHLFLGGPPPPEPYPGVGPDPTGDPLGCRFRTDA